MCLPVLGICASSSLTMRVISFFFKIHTIDVHNRLRRIDAVLDDPSDENTHEYVPFQSS